MREFNLAPLAVRAAIVAALLMPAAAQPAAVTTCKATAYLTLDTGHMGPA